MPRLGPFKGIRNTVPAEQIEVDELAQAVNVDVNDKGRLLRRHGTTVLSAGAADSLFQHRGVALFRRSNVLRRLAPDGSSTQLVTGVMAPVCYCGVDERVYWSDGLVTGALVHGEPQAWGIVPPLTQPGFSSLAGGGLPRGRYRYAVTYVRDGLESGTGAAGETTEIHGTLVLSAIPTASGIDKKRVYLTHPNGRELYHAMTLAPGATTASYSGDTTLFGARLETQFKQHPPPAACLAEHNGRVLLGVGHHMLFTDAYRHDLVDPVRQSYRFDSPVRMLAAVEGGVYVGTDTAVEFLAGQDVASAAREVKATYGVVPGAVAYVEASFVGVVQLAKRAVLMATQEGLCIGGAGGQFVNLTFDRYAYPSAEFGAVLPVLEDGRDRLIAALRRL